MNRRKFIKVCRALGIIIPLQPFLNACTNKQIFQNDSTKPVIIIGAGAAGLVAGYLLKQQGICIKILEASSNYGGRMKRTSDFSNFPIPLGAEWIHAEPKILDEIVNDDSVDVDIDTLMYDPENDYALYEGEKISIKEMEMSEDSKFVNSTWFDFFEQYIAPSIEKHIVYSSKVKSIDYSTDEVIVETHDSTHYASRVIVTAPIKILQQREINFTPELPKLKQDAIDKVKVWGGFKAFIEFSDKFYPALIGFNVNPPEHGEKLYYDAAYGQNTTHHILGLFAVGAASIPYVDLQEDEIIKYILDELDALFDGKASTYYVKHIIQNWNTEPHIFGAYVRNNEDWRQIKKLGESTNERLFFAGDAYTDGQDWGSVHAAVYSAKRAVKDILKS
ncbi:flavin monoamine oxidase family protein [Pseudoalteromonas obscura]|uniref:Tryptophan 2-monooxygenase n=1 Tax=Pseudoalteromonas obscura TaxID=3048491 RepID=A0ABT7ENI4_9GAMM|nr:FAD-dependent oxidoreductase [Pseudoalteromonas sp. P94(2023)]MDK2596612.1 FAD-dependent oxidoreductase [Pseudoalteromonas sp. P94(2023)]